jgi:hypothetical protein
MPERLQQPRTMVACTAGFDRDHRRRKLLEECEHLLAPQLLPQNRFLSGVYSVKLENVFRRIHTNSANLFHGRPPLSEIYSDLILARLMPSGAVHTNRIRLLRQTPISIKGILLTIDTQLNNELISS